MQLLDLGWMKGLVSPQTVEEQGLQSILLGIADPATYPHALDSLRNLDLPSRRLVKQMVHAAREPHLHRHLVSLAVAADKAFDQSQRHFDRHGRRVVYRHKGTTVRSRKISASVGDEELLKRLRYVRQQILWAMPDVRSEAVHPPLVKTHGAAPCLKGFLSEAQIARIKQPSDSTDRCFQAAFLHLVDPEVYDTTVDILSALSLEDSEAIFALMNGLSDDDVCTGMVDLAEQADRAFSSKCEYFERSASEIRIRTKFANERFSKRVSIQQFGMDRAMKRARYIRDRLLYQFAMTDSPYRKVPIKGLRLAKATKREGKYPDRLDLVYRFRLPDQDKFNLRKVSCTGGFQAAFCRLRASVEAAGGFVSVEAIQSIRPTQGQYDQFIGRIPDLPLPFS
ncbi:TPA: hypothetical protein VDU83_002574 [Pseudomonas aeruginosa]|nr:hypothetical protein [Pseudomonas aeruginosa]